MNPSAKQAAPAVLRCGSVAGMRGIVRRAAGLMALAAGEDTAPEEAWFQGMSPNIEHRPRDPSRLWE